MAILMKNNGVWDWLRASGIIKEGESVHRVLIDIRVDDVVAVYKEGFADESWFDVAFPAVGLKVVEKQQAQDIPPAQ